MTVIAEFHGVHAAPRQDGYVPIEWAHANDRSVRIRVRDHTCACSDPSYELCQSGGLLFIRRTTRQRVVSESPWLVTEQGLRLWQMLLTGRAG